MKKILFIGNTPYQILLATWIKYHYYNDDSADILIHNRLKGYERVKSNLELTGVFNNVIVLPNQYKKTTLGKTVRILREYQFAQSLKNNGYDELFSANFDFFVQRVYDFIKRNNSHLIFNYFEDGFISYSKNVEYFYKLFSKPHKGNLTHDNIFVKNYIYNNMECMYLFTPELLEWNPHAKRIVGIDSIDRTDDDFKRIVNLIFDFDNLEDNYDKKYIFFEQAFFQDTGYMEDIRLIDELADVVGKDNLMIKIHPRNQVNRFKERGYKTNMNTVIPWEVLALNLDLDGKVLLTIASSSIINPKAMFNCNAKAFSMLNCLTEKPSQINSDYNNTVINFFRYFDNITMCNEVKEITEI